MTNHIRILFLLLCAAWAGLFTSSTQAQGLDPMLDQDIFYVTTAGGSFSLTGSIFSNYSVSDPPVYVSGLDYIEDPGTGLPDIFDQIVLSDNEFPFIINTITNPVGSGLTTGFTLDTFTLDTSSVSDPSTLVGEYDFTLNLVDSNGNEGAGAAFALDVISPDSSSATTPEPVSPLALSGLLVAGCIALRWRKLRTSNGRLDSPAISVGKRLKFRII